MGEKQEKIAKNNEGEKKSDGGVNTIVLQFDMHCEGCAKKVRKSINKLEGVESVKTDVSNNKLMVTGKVDPVMVKEKVEEKMKKKAELVSLQPNKAAKEGGSGSGGDGGKGGKKKSDDKKPEEKKSEGKPDDKKKSAEGKSDDKKKSEDKEKPKEPPVATVQLKTRVHCEGCAQKIKKIVSKCQGVQDVNVDLQKDLITTKGTMDMKELLPYLNVKLKRAVELAPAKKDQAAAGDKKAKDAAGKENEKPKEGGGSKAEKSKGPSDNADKKDSTGDKKEGGGGGEKKKDNNGAEASSSKDNSTRVEVSRMEYNPYGYGQAYSYAYDPRQQSDQGYGHQVVEYWHAPEFSQPPQMFSDENPNACSLM